LALTVSPILEFAFYLQITGQKIACHPQKSGNGFSPVADHGTVELSEPITGDNKTVLCKAGNSLAIRFLAAWRAGRRLRGFRSEQ